MKDAEETIERLLAGLRDAEPPGGMERRILEALDGIGAGEATSSAWLWRPAMASFAVCAVIVLVAVAVHPYRPAPADLVHSATTAVRQTTRAEESAQKAPIPPRRTASRVSLRHPHDVHGAEKTEAASFPAPPLPLTEQERLLLRLAHRGERESMALLNPDFRAAQTAKATEQFQQFFAIDAKEMRSQSE